MLADTILLALVYASSASALDLWGTWGAPFSGRSQKPLNQDASCYSSHMTPFSSIPGPVPFSTSPTESVLLPKLPQLNATAGEQWEFDCTSDDGDAGLLVGFYRDAAYAFLGPGNLRLSLDVVFSNGTTWSLVDYLEESIITECNGMVVGNWSKASHSYVFEIASDASDVTVTFNTPVVQGTFRTKSIAPPRYADGEHFPSPESSTQNAPMLHWVEPIPGGSSDVHLLIDGAQLSFAGFGGHMRFWGPRSWFDSMKQWKAFRAVIGPYALSFWAAYSRTDDTKYPTIYLAKDGKRRFSSRNMLPSNTSADDIARKGEYFTYEAVCSDTGVRGSLANCATSYLIEMHSEASGKRWKFELKHKAVEFEFALDGGNGGTAFVGEASGGAVGGKRYQGSFFNEQVDISDLSIPSFYVVGATWFHWVSAWVMGF